jgi:hypothetical protein
MERANAVTFLGNPLTLVGNPCRQATLRLMQPFSSKT